MTAIETIKRFVEASISPKEFERKMHTDPSLEQLLKIEDRLPAYVAEPDLYTYLIGRDYGDPGSIYSAQTLLAGLLEKKSIACRVDRRYEQLFNLVLKVQPKWLSLSSDYLSYLLEDKESCDPKALEAWLKETIKSDFRSLKKPPRWLQEPAWPIRDGKPMVFLGQIDISDLRHDNAQAYLFLDELASTFHTIAQSC
ncbi:hypothetical protein JR065_00500 [Xanthomonas sp. AmX2]|uniref:hypothetical protein n=1 Tax=Xanthomonas sp. TaxID=29446 RepID=UPI00197DF022|nr:hypothetical protein [Xanthomonas sp.]MBN6148805.1 hypothetical protein [Xanthomonas sp.]